jgi:hypothetical protein
MKKLLSGMLKSFFSDKIMEKAKQSGHIKISLDILEQILQDV